MKKISIIGSGLAGLSSAISLSNEGHKVSVYEQNGVVGGGGDNFQAVRNYDLPYDFLSYLKEKGIKVNNAKPITKIIKYSPSGKSMVVQSDTKPLFYVFRRGNNSKESIDNQLYNQAVSQGVSFLFNERRTLTSGDIVATGPIFRNVWGYGAVFEGVHVDESTIHLFMENNYAPKQINRQHV